MRNVFCLLCLTASHQWNVNEQLIILDLPRKFFLHTHTHTHTHTLPTNHCKCNFNPFKMLNSQQHSLHTPGAQRIQREREREGRRRRKKNCTEIHAYLRFHAMAYILRWILCQMPLKHMMMFETAGARCEFFASNFMCFENILNICN